MAGNWAPTEMPLGCKQDSGGFMPAPIVIWSFWSCAETALGSSGTKSKMTFLALLGQLYSLLGGV
jgi:hypothetical protein